MPHRIFISYASENSAFAEKAYARLRHSGVSCWIAASDIPPGAAVQSMTIDFTH